MSEWDLVSVLVAFVIGFVSGLIYALRLYKHIEEDCDREWAKRRGMREKTARWWSAGPPAAEIVRGCPEGAVPSSPD